MKTVFDSTKPFRAKVFAILIVAALAAAVVGCGPEAVTFPDPNLEAALREAMGKPEGDIYPEDLEAITGRLQIIASITDLTGLEYCVNVTELALRSDQIISDISPLAGLTNLIYLELEGNGITDISPLAGLTNLRVLLVADNQIGDISPLANLTNLRVLVALRNQINDISSLEGLTSLEMLHLERNQISDISPLANLTNLRVLTAFRNQISDISSLEGLTSLEMLALERNQISDISPLVDNPGLGTGDYVILMHNPLSAQSIMEYIPALRARGVDVSY